MLFQLNFLRKNSIELSCHWRNSWAEFAFLHFSGMNFHMSLQEIRSGKGFITNGANGAWFRCWPLVFADGMSLEIAISGKSLLTDFTMMKFLSWVCLHMFVETPFFGKFVTTDSTFVWFLPSMISLMNFQMFSPIVGFIANIAFKRFLSSMGTDMSLKLRSLGKRARTLFTLMGLVAIMLSFMP